MFNRKLTFTPLVLEVVGEMDDVIVKQVLDLLHSYRSRYSPLFRLLCTLTSVSHSSENEMFERLAEKAKTQLHCSSNMQKSAYTPLYALSIAYLHYNHIPVIKRFHTNTNDSNTKHLLLTSSQLPKSHHSDCLSDMCTFYTKRLSSTQTSVIDELETFMSYYFLPLCITHNFMSELTVESDKDNMMHKENKCQDVNNLANDMASNHKEEYCNKKLECSSDCPLGVQSCEEEEQSIEAQKEENQSNVKCQPSNTRGLLNLHDIDHFILRHYVHETTRTCSFLIADTASHQAALIDPQCNIDEYLNDLYKFDLNLAVIIYTHCPVDIAIGVNELQTHFPTCTIVGGLAEQSNAGQKSTYPLSSTLSLRTTNIPSFAPESLLVELFVQEICIALFTGTALSTDSLPSTSFYCFHEALQEQCNSHTDQESHQPSKQQQQQQFTSLPSSPPLLEEEHQNINNTPLIKCQETITNEQRVMQIAQHNLKTYLYDTFLCPMHKIDMLRQGSNSNVNNKEKNNLEREQEQEEEILESNAEEQMPKLHKNTLEEEEQLEKIYNALQQVILFPARGGYNNGITHQLDLYWAVSVRDFTHMSHSQRVVEALTSFDKYVKFMKQTHNNKTQNKNEREEREEHFPHLLYKSIWQYNHDALWKAHMANIASLQVEDDCSSSTNNYTNKVKLHVNEEDKSALVDLHEKMNNCNSKLNMCVPCKMQSSCYYTLVIDVRPLPEYEERHVKYSIHTPMNFPATAFNAKKAELWLQNLLLPHCSVLVICSSTTETTTTTMINNTTTKETTFCMKDEVAKRFRLIAPSIKLRVCTAEEIDEIIELRFNAHNKHSVECDSNFCGNNNILNDNSGGGVVVANSTVKCSEHWQPLEWVYASAQKRVFSRVTTAEELLQMNLCHCTHNKSYADRSDKHQNLEELKLHNKNGNRCCAHNTVMVDIRTYAEFKNGSHVNSIHIPLGEMCEEVIQDVLNSHEYKSNNIDSIIDQTCNVWVDTESSSHVVNKNTQECFVYVPSINLAKRFLHTLHNQAERTNVHLCGNANELKRIVLYCASGYRTLIAASILQRAFDAASAASTQAKAEHEEKHCKCNIGDTHDCEFLECVRQIQIQDVKVGALQIMTQRPDLWVLKDRSIICISWPRESFIVK